MFLTKRSLLAAALSAAAILPAHAQQITLDVLYCFPSFARFHEPVAAEFMKKNPNIKINFRAPSPTYDDGHQVILRSALTRQLPDIFYSGFHLLPEMVRTLDARGQITVLDGMLAAEGAEFAKTNYPQSLMSLAVFNKKTYGIAFNASNPIVYFNADLVKKAGGDPNNFPKTFDGIIKLAAKINDPANGINGMAYDVHGWPDSWLFEAAIGQAGGRLLNAEGTDIAFDGPAGLNAMKTFRRFVTEGGMQLIDWDQSRQQFGAGKIGIIFSTPAHLTQVTGLVGNKFDLKTSTFPMDDPKNGYIPTGGNAVVMLTQDAAKQKAAWEFIKFVTGPEAQKIVVEMTGYLPTNARASGADFLGPFYEKNPNYKTPILQIDRAGPWGAYPGGNTVRIWRAQRDIVGQVMRGEKTPEQGLADIVKTTRDMMKGA
ncbi:ABC transporter substrate-binding protein [Rhabdaerophilum sp. SD176]|uniref:ABC transporter substrate-binding protein n=1 Tax=Rhabdaerophilum sp. SD176 TaxID=2983548 RepID=UPI0024DF6519|nr:ABC transporter substrate-binding protein [Rhabdaerophilum sp. SD176]